MGANQRMRRALFYLRVTDRQARSLAGEDYVARRKLGDAVTLAGIYDDYRNIRFREDKARSGKGPAAQAVYYAYQPRLAIRRHGPWQL